MRAIVAAEHGGPEILQLRELEPLAVPDGATVVHVVSAGVNFSDVLAIAGRYPGPPPPFVPGIEVAGHEARTGRPVIALVPSGGYAEAAAANPRQLFDADGLDLEQAGGHALVTMAAYFGLARGARLEPGETVMVLAAAGGLGLAALQVARALGAGRVVGVASTERKRALALAHGADEALPYGDDLPPTDVVVDGVGGQASLQAYRAARRFGRVLLLGASSGAQPHLAPFQELRERSVALVPFSFKALRGAEPEYVADRAAVALDLIRRGDVCLPVARGFPLEQAADALRLLAGRESVGKLLLRP